MYKVISIADMEAEGWDFESLTFILYGSGPWICMEYDSEIGWFPWCGTNRFKTKHEAEQAIKCR